MHTSIRTLHKNLIDREIKDNSKVSVEQNDITVAIPLWLPRESGMTANPLQGPTLRDPDITMARLEQWIPPDMNDDEDLQPPHLLPREPKNKTGEPPPSTTSITSIVSPTPLQLYKQIPKQDNIDYEAEPTIYTALFMVLKYGCLEPHHEDTTDA